MDLKDIKIVLASASPSRRMLFEQLGIAFTVRVSGVDETVPAHLSPEEKVEILSKRKLYAVKEDCEGCAVIAADSLIDLNGETLGKPETPQAARLMLRRLSGQTHHVVTGVSIAFKGQEAVFSRRTAVTFYDLTDQEIAAYVDTGESMGRAGAYGIEGKGALLIKSINGDYANIVGLPLAATFRCLRDLGLRPSLQTF